VPIVAVRFVTPYYADDLVTIYHGDCRELRSMFLDGVDVIVTDPPYGVGWTVAGRNNQRTWAKTSTGNASGSIRGSGRHRAFPKIRGDDEPFDPVPWLDFPQVVLFGANHYADRLPASPSWLIWDKRIGMNSNDQADVEMAWTNLGGPAPIFRLVWNGGASLGKENGIPVGRGRVVGHHPTQKPVALMRWVIQRTDGMILDPYMGSGSTLVAAKSLGIRSVGIEIEERYCEIAAQRCSQEVLGLSA
jgi:site-specific DNA-methyltransferase (adenine-specific)